MLGLDDLNYDSMFNHQEGEVEAETKVEEANAELGEAEEVDDLVETQSTMKLQSKDAQLFPR